MSLFFFFINIKGKLHEKNVCFILTDNVSLDCCYGYAFKDKPADRRHVFNPRLLCSNRWYFGGV